MNETDSIPAVIAIMLRQLGGQRIFLMAFEGSVYGCENDRPPGAGVAGLTLRIARPLVRSVRGKATHVIVQLESDDTYTVKTMRVRGLNVTTLETLKMVYGDKLRSVVEYATGLTLALNAGEAVAS